MKVHFRIYLFDSLDSRIKSLSQILLNCVWRHLKLYYICPEKNESCSFSDDREIKLNEVIHYV